MLKWLVQKMPDPIKSGIGNSNDGKITIESVTDDPLATLDFRSGEKEGMKHKIHPTSWLPKLQEAQNCKEVYSVNRYVWKLCQLHYWM